METYRYIGTVIDNKLSWKQNLKCIIKKTHSCLYRLRKIRSFNVSTELLQMFYTSTVSSVLTFRSACWGGNAAKQDKDRLEKNIKEAEGIVGRKQESLHSAYHRLFTDRLNTSLADEMHPLRLECDS